MTNAVIPALPLNPWRLGASLYTPATRPDLLALGAGHYPSLTSLIYCTEDAVLEADLPRALTNLARVLPLLPPPETGPLRLIRARNPAVLAQLLTLDLHGVSGFVLPKIHAGNLSAYLRVLDASAWPRMPVLLTLETPEALSEAHMATLRDLILDGGHGTRVAALRIGGNDLMHALGVRRKPGRTLYEGPLERVISMLLGVFKPHGFALSSPVYEVFRDLPTLARELEQDLDYGLCGKTIIHPAQLDTVLAAYRVAETDLEEARAILAPDAPAVFQMHGRMCEPATHTRWAGDILSRAELYGVLETQQHEALHF
ncbi:HpcH/HpaI aldolase/citrate lyase family protein [Deinococcus arenicola]|uniref:HpcH/HpaI aldolase/citrate lyase family protein n=1 Tax=Deinococcus arenicola TaxID=2994950 RepID=A0ABU4DS58_9DEIO|nr:HpcH/HpaI aldolase/citrate lyase family protein [Deinococcus sp. ZS9-10]MDV6375270.1 HpcH/HpaI aldolase/citrate lyase family protein [Deinococcus sp. ZS9-10]